MGEDRFDKTDGVESEKKDETKIGMRRTEGWKRTVNPISQRLSSPLPKA